MISYANDPGGQPQVANLISYDDGTPDSESNKGGFTITTAIGNVTNTRQFRLSGKRPMESQKAHAPRLQDRRELRHWRSLSDPETTAAIFFPPENPYAVSERFISCCHSFRA